MNHAKAFAATLLMIGLLSSASLIASEQTTDDRQAEITDFFKKYVGLNNDQIKAIREGQSVAKILDAPTADEVFVFGGVYVHSIPEEYLKLASDIDALRKLPSYLAIKKFSDPPQLSDLDGLTLEDEDLKDLQKCREGKCEIQLPTDAMDDFRTKVDWSAPDAHDQANRLTKALILEALKKYNQGGNAALGTYRDKNNPAAVAEAFQSLISRARALPIYLPELHSYLLNYPHAKSDNIQSEFYWEKVNFGLKPTIRLVQAVIYRGADASRPAYAVAVKQLYASHYFQTALDLTICILDNKSPQPAMFLITLKGSQQAGLTGFKGSIVRKVAVDKTRSSLERALAAMKVALESRAKQ